jgi:hypothetical protein
VKRAAVVVVIALMIASVSGINEASVAQGFSPVLAREQQTQSGAEKHQSEMAARAQRIGVNRVVRIERTDGTESNFLLEAILPDAITVVLLDGPDRRKETIPFTDITDIDEVRGRKLRNILIVVGIGAAVLVGACAVALNSVEGI